MAGSDIVAMAKTSCLQSTQKSVLTIALIDYRCDDFKTFDSAARRCLSAGFVNDELKA